MSKVFSYLTRFLPCIRENAANQSRKRQALFFWGNKALTEALTAWRAFIDERQQVRAMMQQAAEFWMRCSLRSAFYGWLDGAARSQETKLALRKATGFFTNRLAQVSAFTAASTLA